MSEADPFTLRPATAEDDPVIVTLLSETLGWQVDDRHRALFRWKHRDNPFGPSPGWVATDDAGLVGSRTLMRWRFRLGDETVTAVRAVDTATHPRAQGRGIFRSLTMRGVEEMTAEGVDWVFNTPNDRSAPGYVSMGWRRMGHLPVALRPAGIGKLPHLVGARRPAELWSVATQAGEDAGAVTEESDALAKLLDAQPPSARLRTERSPAYLAWRYGACPVGYRALLGGSTVSDGVVFFRLRRRGAATEAVIGDVVVPDGDASRAGRLCRQVLRVAGADYVIAIGAPRPRRWLPVPGDGPLLTWRALARPDAPPIEDWALSTGDVELF
ncbi:MAG TPA: GNAT family N-acetyltransferase [Acidimicrobiales bacterium]|nr:GNAT family N-acetyltransferase [Acidimicrobiales bacterium]